MSNEHEAEKAASGEDNNPMAKFTGFSTVDGVRQEPEKPAQSVPAKEAAEGEGAEKEPAEDNKNVEKEPSEGGKVEGSEGAKDEGDEDTKKAKKDPQTRINKAVRAQRMAERERDAYKAEHAKLNERLARLEGRESALTKPDAGRTVDPNAPDPEKYEYGESDVNFIRDLSRYEAKKAFEEQSAEEKKQAESRQEAEVREQFEANVRAFTDKGLEKYDDFDEVVMDGAANNEWPLSDTIGELLFTSDHGADIAYTLASNPKEALELFNKTPAQQAAWFGRKEAELSSKAPGAQGSKVSPNVSQAPAPLEVKVRGAGGSTSVSPDTQDFAAFERLFKEGT